MNAQIYKAGIVCLHWLSSRERLARRLDHFVRVWQRYRKLRTHLRAHNFDGVIDGGANVGEFAQIVRAALPLADLLCVEPNPVCARSLRQQGFRVSEAALWKESARLTLTQPTAASTSGTVMQHVEGTKPATDRHWEVDAVRLDALPISGSRLLVKLDLQGAELHALTGMDSLWERCAGMLLEVSLGPDGTHEQLRDVLTERGFYEYSTTNELEVDGRVVEADKLWLRA